MSFNQLPAIRGFNIFNRKNKLQKEQQILNKQLNKFTVKLNNFQATQKLLKDQTRFDEIPTRRQIKSVCSYSIYQQCKIDEKKQNQIVQLNLKQQEQLIEEVKIEDSKTNNFDFRLQDLKTVKDFFTPKKPVTNQTINIPERQIQVKPFQYDQIQQQKSQINSRTKGNHWFQTYQIKKNSFQFQSQEQLFRQRLVNKMQRKSLVIDTNLLTKKNSQNIQQEVIQENIEPDCSIVLEPQNLNKRIENCLLIKGFEYMNNEQINQYFQPYGKIKIEWINNNQGLVYFEQEQFVKFCEVIKKHKGFTYMWLYGVSHCEDQIKMRFYIRLALKEDQPEQVKKLNAINLTKLCKNMTKELLQKTDLFQLQHQNEKMSYLHNELKYSNNVLNFEEDIQLVKNKKLTIRSQINLQTEMQSKLNNKINQDENEISVFDTELQRKYKLMHRNTQEQLELLANQLVQ